MVNKHEHNPILAVRLHVQHVNIDGKRDNR